MAPSGSVDRRETAPSPPAAVSTMKRAYKLQEFVAHATNVNCLKIGKKTSRVLVTGGEDHKVNMWAIGRPNAIMSLSGHSSAVESVTFDTAEALVAAGAASGTIKLWDLEEAKIVRTLTGHRSNCIAVDFHPFGEFFASGSLDTNLKIWDIRRKGCIHTYKGHTRGVNAIKFSPDGRWVVSGGEDNIVKLWDLTAGKLMHDFKCHEGQIMCLDFHPHEFLLATGSADRTVKFWDLETFELIGSAGPETTGVRSMIFNPDGRTLLAGLHENLKVFSWEPLRCHDVIDVGWSKLADLNIHEGKLLGCSYNQSCVGIWVVDLTRVGPYAPGSNCRTNGVVTINQPSQQMVDGSLKSSSVVRNALPHAVESSLKDMKLSTPPVASESAPSTPQRNTSAGSTKVAALGSSAVSACMLASRRVGAGKVQSNSMVQPNSKLDTAPVIVPRMAQGHDSVIARPILEIGSTRNLSQLVSSYSHDSSKLEVSKSSNQSPRVDPIAENGGSGQKSPVNRGRVSSSAPFLCSELSNEGIPASSDSEHGNVKWIGTGKFRRTASSGAQRGNIVRVMQPPFPEEDAARGEDRYSGAREASYLGPVEAGRVRSVASAFDKKETAGTADVLNIPSGHVMRSSMLDTNTYIWKGSQGIQERSPTGTIDDSDIIEQLMQQHNSFASIMQSRLTKLQVVRRFWTKNDLKGAVEAIAKMADHSVLVDVLSCLVDRGDAFTLEVCTLLLPLLNGLLSSTYDRYLSIALAVLSVLVRNFGQVIHTTRTASPSFGVDLHAEERIERCNSCYLELQVITQTLVPLLRRGGDIGKSAQDLSIALQEV
ncbi:hypothetical protein L7F22_047448 [Adiantum nelumboides]|nr:hypothetical protein [Adiantum nelumboides]